MVVFGCASVLLSYPGSSAQEFEKDLLSVEDALCRLSSSRARDCLMDTRTWLASIPLEEAAAYYVSTFDLNDQHALHLTYHALGDTRQRGMALAALVDAYHEAGFQLVPGELPDFLPAFVGVRGCMRSREEGVIAVSIGAANPLSSTRDGIESLRQGTRSHRLCSRVREVRSSDLFVTAEDG